MVTSRKAQILIWDYQNFENPKKKIELLKNIFFFNSSFSGASNDPPKYKIPEKNPVRHLEYASSPTYQKIINVVGEEHIELC